jgi:hypothetical protein
METAPKPLAIGFAEAYWQWMRREITAEPNPVEFGLTRNCGEGIARQCHIEFERGVKQRIDKIRERMGNGGQVPLPL